MSVTHSGEAAQQRPLRLWPGVVLVVLQWLLRFVIPPLFPDTIVFGMPLGFAAVIGALFCGIAIVLWWLFFSRATWLERLGAILIMVAALYATSFIVHKSIKGGMMGMMLYIYAIPILSLALVGSAVVTRRFSVGARRAAMFAVILIACAGFTLLRTEGISGRGTSDFKWRWTETPEERLLAQGEEKIVTPPSVSTPKKPPEVTPQTQTATEATATAQSAPTTQTKDEPNATPSGEQQTAPSIPAQAESEAAWPGFRGPDRNSIIRGVNIATDWSAAPPVELWRRPIGPGWSSFAVRGDLLYTQEQRGEEEIVACHNITTGEPVWKHRDAARFWESNAGPGPRGTPTLNNGRVYTFGATGIVNALDADDGSVVWSRNAASDTGKKIPGWGFSSSPLVVDDSVIVAAAGKLVAYELSTGKPRWFGPDGKGSYSSPHLLTIEGATQVVLSSGTGVTSVVPADGKVLWQHPLPAGGAIVQPALTPDGDVLISEGDGKSLHRVAITKEPSGWTIKERWNTIGLKPYYNDFVIHNGHAYGIDGNYLACIDLKDGNRKWKGGKYGAGQLILIADQDLLLVLSEKGELALVSAVSDKFTELSKFPAIQGKTWNHPVLVRDVVLVRNGEEMAAFRLPLANR